ncbi:uncharacterized protein LOC118438966 [Folsomia candida]|uniref:uncharacterized protein LOC118438966 n=1 Tax=Folsomia candida TaxID=158441 RepID=UPI001604D6D3|nr:uncharacterized protein LOC118438966 [Folsomia candida]
MCSEYPPIKPSSFKGNYYEYGLYLHNWYRKRHGAPALKLAKWMNDSGDNYCEKLARHGGALVHSSGLGYGENLWGGPQAKAYIKHLWPESADDYMHKCAVREAVKAWYKEVEHYNYNHGGFSMHTGHFTAMVWKSSTELGIGVCVLGGTIIVAGCYKVHPNMQGQFTQNVLRYRHISDEAKETKPVDAPKPVESLPAGNVDGAGHKWIAAKNGGSMPSNMVLTGLDGKHDVYVARAKHMNGIIPGKLIVGYGTFVAYDGAEHGKASYEVLTGEKNCFSWVASQATAIPKNAIVGGKDPNGSVYHVGKGIVNDATAVGKILGGKLYVSYGGKEYCQDQGFQILVTTSDTSTVDEKCEVDEIKDDGGVSDENPVVVDSTSPEMKLAFDQVCDANGTIGWYELKDLIIGCINLGENSVAWDKVICRMFRN